MSLTVKNIRFVPSAHRRVTFAEQVRRAALEWRPTVIAVELPQTLEEWIVRGVMRLPQISAVCWTEPDRPGELDYLPIDPCDAMIEAVRLGCQHAIPLKFIDLDLRGLQEKHRYLPDDMIIDKTGLAPYAERLAPLLAAGGDDPGERAREHHMAIRLRSLSEDYERVLCVIGLAHYTRVQTMVSYGKLRRRSN